MTSSLSSTAIDVEEAAPSDERTPLIASSSLLSFPEPPPLKAIKENTWKECAVTGTAAVAVSTCIGSMLLEAPTQPSVYVSSAIGCLVAPYTAIQQEKITQVEALTETNERLTSQLKELHDENARLQTQVHDLEQSVVQYVHTYTQNTLYYAQVYLYSHSHILSFCMNGVYVYIVGILSTLVFSLEEMKQTLKTVQATEGQSLNELERQLTTSKEILDKMQDNLMADIMQTLITVVVTCNKDGDLVLGDDEISAVVQKMERLQNMEFKEDLLRAKLVSEGRSLNAILHVCKNLLDNDIPADQNIFSFIETPSNNKE